MIVGIETGGTKVVCAAARTGDPGAPAEVRRLPTTGPAETLRRIDDFLGEIGAVHGLDAIGVASFGPVNVDPALPGWARITGTSKPGWDDVDLLAGLPAAAGLPATVMSDVSGAALGEWRWGAAAGAASAAYATFGTGVGVGVIVRGRVVHGNGFPEIGHLLVRRHPDDGFRGVCPFHDDCVEGLASGPAVAARWGADSSSLAAGVRSEALDVLGWYVAQVAVAVAYAHGVERIVLGGGVMQAPGLVAAARRAVPAITGGALAGHTIRVRPEELLVPARLGPRSGVLGALAAAQDLLDLDARPVLLDGASAV